MRSLGSWRHRHYGEHAVVVVLLVSSFVDWVPMSDPGRNITGLVGVVALVAAFLVEASHASGELCETCISAMPLDTDAAVQRRGWALRLFHATHGSKRRVFVSYGGLLALLVAHGVVGAVAGMYTAPANSVGNLFALLLAVFIVAGAIHRRLFPWCPWCRDDGGDDDRVEEPTPSTPEMV